jgi:uncharacterized protein DUF2752
VLAGLWAAGSALALVARPWLPLVAELLPPCPLHAWLGVPCFACGSTRAALQLAAGDVAGAFLANPLAAAGLSIGWLGGFVAPVWLALGLGTPAIPTELPRPARAAVVGALLANWCFLLARGV